MAEKNSTGRVLAPFPGPTRLSGRHPPDGRELLSIAERILMAARGCSDVQAFDELLDVAQRHHMTVQKAAEDLVGLAAGRARTRRSPDGDCFGEWEKLLTQLSPRRPGELICHPASRQRESL